MLLVQIVHVVANVDLAAVGEVNRVVADADLLRVGVVQIRRKVNWVWIGISGNLQRISGKLQILDFVGGAGVIC